MARYGLARWALQEGQALVWATLIANLLACALLGWLVGTSLRGGAGTVSEGFDVSLALRQNKGVASAPFLFMATGLCGGFSTFSTFSWELLQFVQDGRHMAALLYALGSVVLGLAGVWLGFLFASR